MQSFTTPGPTTLDVRFAGGHLQLEATDRHTTEVDVAPRNPSNSADVEHAAATVVEQRGNEIVVIAPDTKRWFGRTPKLDVRISAPTRSDATADVESADIRLSGSLGAIDVTSASGNLRFDGVASLTVKTASGDVVGDRVEADGLAKSASGDFHLGEVGGSCDLTTASGDINVAAIGGDVQCRTASGDVSLRLVGGSTTAKSASGDVRLGSVRRGTVEIDSASGDVWIGVADGTAAWLDVHSLSGDVRSDLEAAEAPEAEARMVTIRARTLSGDVAIRRAGPMTDIVDRNDPRKRSTR